MRNIYKGKILPTCNSAIPNSGCICGSPKGHTDDHRCQFCKVTWTNQAPRQALSAVTPDELALKEQDERWLEAMGWTDLVQKGPYTQADRRRYVALFADSITENLRLNATPTVKAAVEKITDTKGLLIANTREEIKNLITPVVSTVLESLQASLEEEKAQRKANFVAWQAACATINRLLAEVAELKMLAEVAERQKLLSEAREGHLLRQLPRWKL